MVSDRIAITPANRGPWINIITWTLLVLMVLSTILKLFSKWVMVQELQYDDMYIFASAVRTPPEFLWMDIKTRIDKATAYCHRLRNRIIRPSRQRIRAALASSQ